jgi:hypothetical protein
MLVKLYINEVNEFGRHYFIGETDAITIRTNNRELQGEPVEFLSETKEGIIAQVKARLQSQGLTGFIRLV